MADRFTQQTFSGEGVGKISLDERPAKVVMGGSVAGSNLQRRLEVRNRPVQFAPSQEKIAEIVMRRVVVRGNSKRVVPEHLAVFPIRRLHKRAPAQRNDDRCRDSGAELLVATALWAVCSDSA